MSATSDRNVALYSILVDGSEVDESLSKRIREVRILSYLRLPDMCTLSVVYKGSPNLGLNNKSVEGLAAKP